MREDQNVAHQLGEIKEKGLDQLFHTLYSSCHSSLLSDVCIYACYCSTIFSHISPMPLFPHARKYRALLVVTFSTRAAFCQDPLSYMLILLIITSRWDRQELPASFLQRVLLLVALFWNPDTKSILSKTLPWWLRQEKIIILLIYPKTYASEREWISIISYSGDKTLS